MSDYALEMQEKKDKKILESMIDPKVDFKGWVEQKEKQRIAFEEKMDLWRKNQKPSWSGGFGALEDNIINPNPFGNE